VILNSSDGGRFSERLYLSMFRFLATQPPTRGGADRSHMEPWLSIPAL
jgi:hypothetical protein